MPLRVIARHALKISRLPIQQISPVIACTLTRFRSPRCQVTTSATSQQDRLFSNSARKSQDAQSQESKYTTAFAIFEALWEAGVENCFVNVGSDHPSILEAFVKGKRERPGSWPNMITCPAEITAISAADGYARVTGKPQAVLVHVDVGTQALGQGVHNASLARVPVMIIAGLCSATESGELTGSKTEYSNWFQDVHDQPSIVRQYCRYVGEIKSGLNVKQMVGRALQFANSAPKGPVYLTANREVLAQQIEPYQLDQTKWVPIGPSALPAEAVQKISEALVHAERPLIITGYSGRDKRTPQHLEKLANLIPGIRVHDTGGSDVCFSVQHPASEGFRLSTDKCIEDADVILILDCDVPYIPAAVRIRDGAKIYHVDVDPLNEQLRVSFFPAHGRWQADSFTALCQLNRHIQQGEQFKALLDSPGYAVRRNRQVEAHQKRISALSADLELSDSDSLSGRNVGALLRSGLPQSTTFVVEAVTNSTTMHDQLQPQTPGSWINCGATGIGWSNGAAIGVSMACLKEAETTSKKRGITCQIVGDGSFMCASPTSALWVASRYKIPVLTVVLNNGGWKAPRNSAEMVYPDGMSKGATEDELNISFRPTPNFKVLAEGATDGAIEAQRVQTVSQFRDALQVAERVVDLEQRSMLIEVMI